MKRQLQAAVANRGRAPGQVFGEKLEQVNTSNHYTSQPLTAERISALDRQKMLTFYRQRFSNAADFTFFMVGAFKVDEVAAARRAVRRRRCRRQGRARQRRARTSASTFPVRDRPREGRNGPRATQQRRRSASSPSRRRDPVDAENIAEATTVLDIALRDALREELSQTYTVSVGQGGPGLPQRGGGYMRVSFGAAPENVASMTERVLAEIKKLQQDGPSADLDEPREGSGEAQLRDVAAAERLLAGPPAGRPSVRPRSEGDPHAARAHRRGDAADDSGGLQEELPDRSLHRRDADARRVSCGGRPAVREGSDEPMFTRVQVVGHGRLGSAVSARLAEQGCPRGARTPISCCCACQTERLPRSRPASPRAHGSPT